jgi:glycosyltransferase involved in cell wall biosynthesis
MALAVFSPLPPSPTGIADYSRALIEGLRKHVAVEGYTGTDEEAAATPGCHIYRSFEEGSAAGLAVYQMGNSPYHDFIYPFLFRVPGVLVLHDLVLHHSRLAWYLNSPEVVEYRGDLGNQEKRERALTRLGAYESEVRSAYPERGATVAEIALRQGGGRLLYEYPLHEHLVRASRMVLVHDDHAREEVERRSPGAVVRKVRMGIPIPAPVPREEARRRLELPFSRESLVLASFGLVTPEKRIGTVLGCLKRLVDQGIDAHYLLVGGAVPHYDPRESASRLGIVHRVHLRGRVSEEDFCLFAFAADLCLNLRFPSAGETSATLLRLLAAGRAVMVTDQRQYRVFPPEVLARVDPAGEDDGLYCDVREWWRQPERRRRLEERARIHAEREHSIETMVADYLRCLEEARAIPAPPHGRNQ